jgi:adenylate cyclase
MNSENVKRKLTAILSADVQGYSRLMEDDEQATVETITAYREVMTNLIQTHHGSVKDAKGDNVLAEFPSIVDAIQCAVVIQKELKIKNDELPEKRRMAFRIGVNLGDVIEKEDTIYGDGVNIAARLESLAEGGGICISGTAFDQVGKKLSLGYKYLGEQKVKNIEKPIRAYKVLVESDAVGRVIGERRKLKRWHWAGIIAGVLILFLGASTAAIWSIYFRLPDVKSIPKEERELKLPEGPSIAVMPFVNMSGDADQDYFSDGLTENIITGLSAVPQLLVIARNSTFSYKGKAVKVQEIARELGAQYVVEGSVQKSNNRLRVTAQLIDAKTGAHVWAEHYDRELKEIFAVQDEITIKIIKALRIKLTDGMLVQEVDRYPCSLEAFMKLMKAAGHIYSGNKEGNILARQEAEQAMALAPEHPALYIIIAQSYVSDVLIGASDHPIVSLAKATQSAKKALSLDDSNPGGYITLGFVSFARRDYEKAIAFVEKAITLNPSNSASYWLLGLILTYSEQPEKGIRCFEKAIRLNPKPQGVYVFLLGLAYWMLGQNEKAIAECEKALDQEPNLIPCKVFLIASYISAGRKQKALEAAEELLKIDPEFSMERFARSRPFKNERDRERLIDALRNADLK